MLGGKRSRAKAGKEEENVGIIGIATDDVVSKRGLVVQQHRKCDGARCGGRSSVNNNNGARCAVRVAAGREETGVPLSTSGSSSAMSRDDDDASKTMKSEEKDRKDPSRRITSTPSYPNPWNVHTRDGKRTNRIIR